MYVVNTELPDKIAAALGGLYTLVYNKYCVDEAYDAAVVTPLVEGSTTVLWHGVDQGVIDGVVNGVGNQSQRYRRRSQTDSIGQHPKLRDLGAGRALSPC